MRWIIKKYSKNDGFIGYVNDTSSNGAVLTGKLYQARQWCDMYELGKVLVSIAQKDPDGKYTLTELNNFDIENIARAKLAKEILGAIEDGSKYGDGYTLDAIERQCNSILDEEYWRSRQG